MQKTFSLQPRKSPRPDRTPPVMSTQNLNVSGQDMLLLDNSTSYFQNLGYTRTSNFQFKLKQLDPQNVPRFGATTTYKIQKQDHLLGNVDLQLRLKMPSQSAIGDVPQFLTNKFGLAMIERVRFLVGSNLIQEIEGEWLDLENSLYREKDQQYVDIIGDARKRSDLQNTPQPLTNNQQVSFATPETIDAARKLYQVSSNDEYWGTAEPLMPKTNAVLAGVSSVQGRTRAVPVPRAGLTKQPDSIAEPLSNLEMRAMPAYTGVKVVQHLHECLTAGMTGGGVAAATALTTAVGFAPLSTVSAPHATGFTGNPAYVTFTVPLGLFFAKHPSMYLPIMAVAASQDITIEVRLRDLPSLMQHWHAVAPTTTGTPAVITTAKYQILSTPKASTKATYYPAVFPEIDTMQLWCHYIQLSQSEADALQLKDQHVRLVKQIQTIKGTQVVMPGNADGTFTTRLDFKIDLSFLHPVQTLWVVLRDPDELAENEYFHYIGKPEDDCRITALDVVINGTSRMSQKVDTDYNAMRLVPLFQGHSKRSYGVDEMPPAVSVDFALNGQSNNPSGHINFSNAATQQLKLDFRGKSGKTYVVDIYAVGLNWVNIQGGTAKVVFN